VRKFGIRVLPQRDERPTVIGRLLTIARRLTHPTVPLVPRAWRRHASGCENGRRWIA